jgi:hypothetical protein
MKPVAYLTYYPNYCLEIRRADHYRKYGGLDFVDGKIIYRKSITPSSIKRIECLLENSKQMCKDLSNNFYMYYDGIEIS